MGISLPSFKMLLHRARTHMQQASEGTCSLTGHNPPVPIDCETCAGAAENCKIGTGFGLPANSRSSWMQEPAGRAAKQHQSLNCAPGENDMGGRLCNIGIRCCRLIPNLRALRKRLFDDLHASLFYRALLAIGLVDEIPELTVYASCEAVTWLCTVV